MRHSAAVAALVSFVSLLLAAPSARGQTIHGAVLAQREPHHHVAFEDSSFRVLRVHVAPGDSTLLHEHAPDYFWIALGPSKVVNAKLGAPDAVIESENLSIHYTPGHFAHVARNPGSSAFDNITIEVLRPQTNVRNLCEAAIAAAAKHCDRSAADVAVDVAGATVDPAFATDQLRVSLVTVPPGGVMHPTAASGARTWLIALDTLDTRTALVATGAGRWKGGVTEARGAGWTLRNRGSAPRALLVAVERADGR